MFGKKSAGCAAGLCVLIAPLAHARPPLSLDSAVLVSAPSAAGGELKDEESFRAVLEGLGLPLQTVRADEPLAPALEGKASPVLIVVPCSSARLLSSGDIQAILKSVKKGSGLVTDGESPLSAALGVRLGPPVEVEAVNSSVNADVPMEWKGGVSSPWVRSPSWRRTVYYSEKRRGLALAIGARRGRGRWLFFAPLYDPVSGYGYSRFPGLPVILLSEFGARPPLARPRLEAYFEPGDRPDNTSLGALARQWHEQGITLIHAATWHYFNDTPYDYRTLITEAHRNGILVSAWFEWPEVGPGFWAGHPACREKTATLAEAHVDWRELVNLQDPSCWDTVVAATRPLLQDNDWDGVTVGELYFDGPIGPSHPEMFTPMNRRARREFRAEAGFDPLDLFRPSSPRYWAKDPGSMDRFYRYRKRVILGLFGRALRTLALLRKEGRRPWEMTAVLIDTGADPEMADHIGVDMTTHLAAARQFGASVQVEDPATMWSSSPGRYAGLGRRYRALLGGEPYSIDINLVEAPPPRPADYCVSRPVGSETLGLLRQASRQTGRVCVYSESSVAPSDWALVPYALAGQARARLEGGSLIVESSNTVTAEVPWSGPSEVDGAAWPCADGPRVWLPAGRHTVSPAGERSAPGAFKMLSLTGELLSCRQADGGLEAGYASPGRCAFLFNRSDVKLFVDGQDWKGEVLPGPGSGAALLPAGRHRLLVRP